MGNQIFRSLTIAFLLVLLQANVCRADSDASAKAIQSMQELLERFGIEYGMSEGTFLERMARINCPIREVEVHSNKFRSYELLKVHTQITNFGILRQNRLMFHQESGTFKFVSLYGGYDMSVERHADAKKLVEAKLSQLSAIYGKPIVDDAATDQVSTWSYKWNLQKFTVTFTALYLMPHDLSFQIQFYSKSQ